MTIKEDFLPIGKRCRPSIQKFTKEVDLIVIHWIGPTPGQVPSTPRNWWVKGNDGNGVQASAHFIVKDYEILQCLPLDERGMHTGDSRNLHSIGIEVIPKNAAGEFSVETYESLRDLCSWLRQKIPTITNIERHYDGVQKKDCPRYYTPITALVGSEGRVENPEGGDTRWKILKDGIWNINLSEREINESRKGE